MTTGSYKASEIHQNIESEIDRLRRQALVTWQKETRNLAWFGLSDGMSLLEVGSGPGFVTEQLSDLLPSGHVTALEIDPDLVERARKLLAGRPHERYNIVEGDLMHMQFPDNTFDFAYARLVFQHLPDTAGAAREIFRVLKPGGKLAILDIDSGLSPINEPEPSPQAIELIRRIEKWQESRGGNRKIGRRLWRILAGAGFTGMELELISVHSDAGRIELFDEKFDPGAFEPLVRAGVMTEAEVEVMREDHNAFFSAPDQYTLIVAMMVCGTKP